MEYDSLEEEGFRYFIVNHSIQFLNLKTNNVEGMWRHAKTSLSHYLLPKKLYGGCMVKFMFIKRCRSQKLDMLTEFFKYAEEIYDLLYFSRK